MRHSLLLHPACRCACIESIEAELVRSTSGLSARYFVTGDLGGLVLPLPSSPVHADELWRHTCFELFLRAERQDRYYEFNFAPSLAWAAYGFDSYRCGMGIPDIPPPRIEMRQAARTFELHAALDLGRLTENVADWRLGLSVVVEQTNGEISYWALAHPAGKPDFHHGDAFALLSPAREH